MSNPSITADKTPWYQWDTGLTVTVSGGEMNECHFANRKQGTAYVQAVINGVARVPDELLQVAAPIKAYGYVSDGAGGQTYVEQTFEVIARNIPSDYTYTKTSQKTIRDAEAARDQAVQAAKDAKGSELAADDSAVEASNSAQSAGESASAAATSASNAAKSAGDAKAAADNAVEDASELLKTYTDNAKTSADNAATSASNAADAASAASGSASAADQSSTDASNAKAAAQTAKADAETAKTEAAASASNAAASATAAAKSASDAAASVDETLSEAKKYTDANTSNALVGTVSGKLLHVEDAWPGKPLGLTIDGAYKQDGTPSPDNPVPIQVVENPVVKVTGRNLLDTEPLNDRANLDTSSAPYGFYIYKLKLPTVGDYTVSVGKAVKSNAYLATATTANPNTSAKTWFSHPSVGLSTKVTYYDVDVIYIYFSTSMDKVAQVLDAVGYLQVEADAQATAHAPYAGTSLPITLPAEHPYLAALPDGTHDEIVIDKDGNASLVARVGAITLDDINKAFNYEEKVNGADFQVYLGYKFKYGVGLAVSNVCVGGNVNQDLPVNGGVIKGGYVRMTKPEKVTDIASAKEYLIEIGFAAYIALTNTVTYQLGKIDIPSLPETISNVWTDAELTTNMSMTYKRDINIAFDNLVQAVVASVAGE